MTVIELTIAFIIASYLRNILDGIIMAIYETITGKELKEVTIKWSK